MAGKEGCFNQWTTQTAEAASNATSMQQAAPIHNHAATPHAFSEEERHDGYHENLDTNHGGPVQKEVPDCIAEVIHQNIPT